jgi:hypothetical protein
MVPLDRVWKGARQGTARPLCCLIDKQEAFLWPRCGGGDGGGQASGLQHKNLTCRFFVVANLLFIASSSSDYTFLLIRRSRMVLSLVLVMLGGV